MGRSIKKIAVTGGSGQIAYNLLFRIASGELFGADQRLSLHILELPEMLGTLEGVRMELEDCAFATLDEIRIGSDPEEIFEGVTEAFLIGSKPRGPGMERGELLSENGKIFIRQGAALDKVADRKVKVLVVGNPCNTNCLIAIQNAPHLSKHQFHAMTRLDQNRSQAALAKKAQVNVGGVSHMTIWGNHSSTQVPDFLNARIDGLPVIEVIKDRSWLEGPFITEIQKRGAAIIAARGKSSAASAASAALDAMRAISTPTEPGKWYSSAVFSEGNPYQIDPQLVFSFPCRTRLDGTVEIVEGLKIDRFLRDRLQASERELIEERQMCRDFQRINQ